jgi:hypothetical protein
MDTGSGNTKIKKTNKSGTYRVASLSLMPDLILCPASKAADCLNSCLVHSGRGVFPSVAAGRQWRADLWHQDKKQFLERLTKELDNFSKLCKKNKVSPAVRLNVLSDINWERYGIPQKFPEIFFFDYTKRADRLGKTPSNYKLIFSYSGRDQYQNQVKKALLTDSPLAVVFRGGFPSTFLNRPVIDGDNSDLTNVMAGPVVIGLKAKGKPANNTDSAFIVDTNRIPALMVAA